MTILLGNGSGGFAPAPGSPFAVGSHPIVVVVSDFNEDGIPDLATPNYNSNNVTILLGNGSGGFAPAPDSPIAVGTNPYALGVGDFNGDGIADLATGNFSSNNASLLLGNSSGGFTPAPGSPFPASAPRYMSVGDFNGDGIADLATTNSTTNNLIILLIGSFTQTATVTLPGVSIPGTGGTHSVEASYLADDVNFSSSTSTAIPLTEAPLPTTLVLTANPGSSSFGQQVVLTATLQARHLHFQWVL